MSLSLSRLSATNDFLIPLELNLGEMHTGRWFNSLLHFTDGEDLQIKCSAFVFEPPRGKTNNVVSEQV